MNVNFKYNLLFNKNDIWTAFSMHDRDSSNRRLFILQLLFISNVDFVFANEELAAKKHLLHSILNIRRKSSSDLNKNSNSISMKKKRILLKTMMMAHLDLKILNRNHLRNHARSRDNNLPKTSIV